jgi:hypothetical protein
MNRGRPTWTRLALVAALAFVALTASAAGTARAAADHTTSSTTVEPWDFQLGNLVLAWEVQSSFPLVRDRVVLVGIGPLVQHTIVLDRTFRPGTMFGHVSGTIIATGPDIWTGELHGRMTPDGMSGAVTMRRSAGESGALTARFIGTWASELPADFASIVTFGFDGHIVEFSPPS